MSKLLHSGIRRYIRSYVFWICVIATTALGMFSSYSSRLNEFDDMYIMTEFLIFGVVISWFVGREKDEGVVRNKVIAGHTKGSIFLSELILAVCVCVFLFLIYAVAFAIFNGYVFEVLSIGYIVKIFVGFLLINISIATIMVVITCLIPRRAISGIINLLLVFAMVMVAYELNSQLDIPEYYRTREMKEVVYTDENGNKYTVWEDDYTDKYELNPQYLRGTTRKIFEIFRAVLPYGQVINYDSFLGFYIGYEWYNPATGEYEKKLPTGMTEEIAQLMPEWVESYEDAKENMTVFPFYSIGLITVVSGLGYYLYKRKDIK